MSTVNKILDESKKLNTEPFNSPFELKEFEPQENRQFMTPPKGVSPKPTDSCQGEATKGKNVVVYNPRVVENETYMVRAEGEQLLIPQNAYITPTASQYLAKTIPNMNVRPKHG